MSQSCIILTRACADDLSFGIAAKAVDIKATATSQSAALYTTSYIILRSACADGLLLGIAAKAMPSKATANSKSAALYPTS